MQPTKHGRPHTAEQTNQDTKKSLDRCTRANKVYFLTMGWRSGSRYVDLSDLNPMGLIGQFRGLPFWRLIESLKQFYIADRYSNRSVCAI